MNQGILSEYVCKGQRQVCGLISRLAKKVAISWTYGKIVKESGKKNIWSNPDPEYHLFGWQIIGDDDRSVVICEGEVDALSWYQQGFPALSVPQGAGGGNKQTTWLANDYDRLLRFETIYVSMDMDPAGRSAVPPIISRLGLYRCKVVDLGEFKDASEVHMNGENLKKYIDNAKTQDPEELRKLADYHEEIISEFNNTETAGISLPWKKTFGQIRLRPSEISVWAGIRQKKNLQPQEVPTFMTQMQY